MPTDYNSMKKEALDSYKNVESLVAELKDYAKEKELPDLTENTEKLLSDICSKAEKVKADRFKIVVAGESKSGKSTFINAYLGVELLPMDVKQCTSSIVGIKYGEKFSVRATYADGRKITITDDEKAREFLKKNAALDDEYRDIPVPTINSEILVKSGRRAKDAQIRINDAEVEAMLKSPEVIKANIHNLPDHEYKKLIKAYIKSKENNWQNIVTKIEVRFSFSEKLRGIEIFDSPGICVPGGVADITSKNIEDADAIIFLKPISGQALESNEFNQFMKNASVERNKNALFLVLTRATNVTAAELKRLESEAHKQFSNLDKRHILIVDSKAKLYANHFAGVEDIDAELTRLEENGEIDDFVMNAYYKTISSNDADAFINRLKEISRFQRVDNALETFGRQAHYILLSEMLNSIGRLCSKLNSNMKSSIEIYKQKAKDPAELEEKINVVTKKLKCIQNEVHKSADNIVRRFRGEDGIIRKKAEEEKDDFLSKAKEIKEKDPKSTSAFNELEKLCLLKIDKFKKLETEVHDQVVQEFNEELNKLIDKSDISFVEYESLQPDFTEETFKEIEENTKTEATVEIEERITFLKPKKESVYVWDKHFEAIKNNILTRLNEIKNTLISHLDDFVENIRNTYIEELKRNADIKKNELEDIKKKKEDAEQIQDIIQELSGKVEKLEEIQKHAYQIEKGIEQNVQQINQT